MDSDGRTGVAIIRGMKENPLPPGASSDTRGEDPRLAEAREALGELSEAEGADALAPAERLADLLEELLEGEGEGS